MDVLDPFEIGDDWFGLEFTFFQVKRGVGAPDDADGKVARTLTLLNHSEFCAAHRDYVERNERGRCNLADLEERAPFVAREMRRQGRLTRGRLLPLTPRCVPRRAYARASITPDRRLLRLRVGTCGW